MGWVDTNCIQSQEQDAARVVYDHVGFGDARKKLQDTLRAQ